MVSAKAVMDNSASVLGLIKAVTTPPNILIMMYASLPCTQKKPVSLKSNLDESKNY